MRPGTLCAPLAAIAVLFATAECKRAPAPSPRTLTIAVRADVTGFYPEQPISDEAYTYDVNWHVLEGLVRFGPSLLPEPALAERWENPDERTYVFYLRPGLRFSDGRPVTAADVAASLEAARERKWVTRDYLNAVESVRATDRLRLVVRTRFPYFILLSKLPWGMVLPADSLASPSIPPIGTGPYRLESWSPGRGFVLTRNPHYRGPQPAFGQARFVVVPDGRERIASLLAGEADVVDHVPLDAVDELQERPEIRVFTGQSLRVIFLGLRVNEPPFSDPRVRQAVDLAIDRDELIRLAYGGRTVPASQIVPRAVVGFDPGLPVTVPDRARAGDLLAEAGHAAGLTIRLDGTNNRYVYDREILEEVRRQLALVGIRVEVNAMDKREFFPMAFSGRSKFHLLGWECQSGEAGQALDSIIHSRTSGMLGGANTTGLVDAELDKLIDRTNSTMDPRERTASLQQAMRRVAELRAVLPLLVQAQAVAVSRRVRWEPPVGFALRVADMQPAECSAADSAPEAIGHAHGQTRVGVPPAAGAEQQEVSLSAQRPRTRQAAIRSDPQRAAPRSVRGADGAFGVAGIVELGRPAGPADEGVAEGSQASFSRWRQPGPHEQRELLQVGAGERTEVSADIRDEPQPTRTVKRPGRGELSAMEVRLP